MSRGSPRGCDSGWFLRWLDKWEQLREVLVLGTSDRDTRTRCRAGDKRVRSGATVEIIRSKDGAPETWTIRGDGFSDPSLGLISSDSPLAKAVLGARVGEQRTFTAAGRTWTVRVDRIVA